MKKVIKGSLRWRTLLVLAPLALLVALAVSTTGIMSASAVAYEGGGGMVSPSAPPESYGLSDHMLFIANGRASNVKVVDVASMKIVDTIPVPPAPVNLMAPVGQTNDLLNNTLGGLGLKKPLQVPPNMFYWEIHGTIPSADLKHVYAIGALSFAPAAPLFYDDIMFEVNTKTKQVDRRIPMSPKVVGYCGLEWEQNVPTTGILWAENMATSAIDLLELFGSPLKLDLNVRGLLGSLGLSGVSDVVNKVATPLPMIGGISKIDVAAGKAVGFISTDWNGNLNSSTCGISWNADGSRAWVSQMFEPVVDTINWNTKTVDGQILPPGNHKSIYHQNTSAKTRGLLFVAANANGIDVFDMNTNALVGNIDVNGLLGVFGGTHSVEIAPGNENVIYGTIDADPNAIEFVLDVTDINAPEVIGALTGQLDAAACGVNAIDNKADYYAASGACSKPKLAVKKTGAYWASAEDKMNHVLSVNYQVTVYGSPNAQNVMITGANATNGVTLAQGQEMPNLGNLSNTQGAKFTLKYQLPANTTKFSTSLMATGEDPCGNVYNY